MRQRRNPVATAPILGKGGAHQMSKTAERVKARSRLRKEVAEWRPPRARTTVASTLWNILNWAK